MTVTRLPGPTTISHLLAAERRYSNVAFAHEPSPKLTHQRKLRSTMKSSQPVLAPTGRGYCMAGMDGMAGKAGVATHTRVRMMGRGMGGTG